jgi:two-component system NtrC family sensor kinase
MTAAWARRQGLERALRELKDTQAKLVESERMAAIGQVARGVGHEFGNILQRIVGKADLLLVATELDKAKAHAEVIMQAAEQAAVIVQNLQSFSKQQKERTEVSLSKIATGTLTLVNHEFVRRGIKLQNGLTPVPAVMGNAVELGQVVMNLIINAMDAMESSVVKNLEIGSRQQDGYVELWVKDSGTGIAPDVLPHIFEYAFTTKGDRGSGLGLAISKKIVESHGGELLCVSQAKQSTAAQGTQFTIKMPVVKGVGAP